MFPTIFTFFLYGFLYHFLSFPAFHVFSIYIFQEFYPSPSVSDRFYTISSGCYRIFLHFHCIFPACLLHRHSLFLAVAPVSSMFQQILHPLFWLLSHFLPGCYHIFLHCIFPAFSSGFCTISSDCYHIFLQFLYPLQGFSIYSCIFNLFFQDFYPSPFYTISFTAFSIYFSKNFTRFLYFPIVFTSFPLVVIAFSCTFTVFFQHVYCIIIVCFLAVTPVSSMFPTDFAWFVPSISLWSLSCFLKFHCIFRYILFMGFQYILSNIFLLHVSYHFHLFPP